MNFLKTILTFFPVLIAIAQNAQSANDISSARSLGIGNQSMTFIDINAVYQNPSGLTYLHGTSFHMSASQPFTVKELGEYSIGVAGVYKPGRAVFGNLKYYGFDQYNEQSISAGYAMRLLKSFSMSVEFKIHSFRLKDYGSRYAPNFSICALNKLSDVLYLGISVDNPLVLKIQEHLVLPVKLAVGIRYVVSDKLDIFSEVEKDVDFPMTYKFGFEYQPLEVVSFRMGTTTNPVGYYFGFGHFLNSGWSIDIAMSWHQVLGITPSIGIGYLKL